MLDLKVLFQILRVAQAELETQQPESKIEASTVKFIAKHIEGAISEIMDDIKYPFETMTRWDNEIDPPKAPGSVHVER